MSIRLNDDAMRQFRVAKVFPETKHHTLAMEFSSDGLRLLVCDHSALSIFSSTRQVQVCKVPMHHYLPDVACFVQQDTRVLHSTSKVRGFKGERWGQDTQSEWLEETRLRKRHYF